MKKIDLRSATIGFVSAGLIAGGVYAITPRNDQSDAMNNKLDDSFHAGMMAGMKTGKEIIQARTEGKEIDQETLLCSVYPERIRRNTASCKDKPSNP